MRARRPRWRDWRGCAIAKGKRVGVVTNDQAHDLVDTNTFRGQGLAVEEVPGACFCCRFDDLVSRVGSLEDSEKPDVILAEPVGSCTDLVATVIQPLKDLYGGRFEVAPYAVLFKPSHGIRILKNQRGRRVQPQGRVHLQEATRRGGRHPHQPDRRDRAASNEKNLSGCSSEQFPGTPVLCVSATDGSRGSMRSPNSCRQKGAFGRKILDIDYDTYAEGEAELGWLNATARLTGEQAVRPRCAPHGDPGPSWRRCAATSAARSRTSS